jgi:hypothetical protein
MKKLFAPLILCAFAAMLLSSCSDTSKLSFTKRHYRSGYFVDATGKNRTIIPVATLPVRVTHPISAKAIVKQENKNEINIPVTATKKTDIVQKKIQENYPVSVSINSIKQVLNKSYVFIENPALQTRQIISESVGSPGDSSRAASAGLSLLWIVIVVILILWLIGLLAGGFGLGGLINVLLIIALILFILWLLRIW